MATWVGRVEIDFRFRLLFQTAVSQLHTTQYQANTLILWSVWKPWAWFYSRRDLKLPVQFRCCKMDHVCPPASGPHLATPATLWDELLVWIHLSFTKASQPFCIAIHVRLVSIFWGFWCNCAVESIWIKTFSWMHFQHFVECTVQRKVSPQPASPILSDTHSICLGCNDSKRITEAICGSSMNIEKASVSPCPCARKRS